MTKRNIERSGESADAFERTSESPDRGALNGGPVSDQLFDPVVRSTGRREVRVSSGKDSGRPPKGRARRLRDLRSPSERDPGTGDGVARRSGARGRQVARLRRLLQRDYVGATRADGPNEDVPRPE